MNTRTSSTYSILYRPAGVKFIIIGEHWQYNLVFAFEFGPKFQIRFLTPRNNDTVYFMINILIFCPGSGKLCIVHLSATGRPSSPIMISPALQRIFDFCDFFEMLMFVWDFEVDASSRFCDMNSTLGSVVPLAMFEHWAGGGPPSLYLTKFLNLIQFRKNLSPTTSVRACTLGVHLSPKLPLYPPLNPQKTPKNRPGGPKKRAKNCAQFFKRSKKPLGKIWIMQKTD